MTSFNKKKQKQNTNILHNVLIRGLAIIYTFVLEVQSGAFVFIP